jgi:small subunit ribosomal protein S14
MAKESLRVKHQRPAKYQTRAHNRCARCGRPRAYYRRFGVCRICLRDLAHQGVVPGMTKSSW